MDATTRMQKVLSATPDILAIVDEVLVGGVSNMARPQESTLLVTVSDAANRIGISRPTAYKLIGEGRLDMVEVRGKQMVRMQSVIDFSRGLRPPTSATRADLAESKARRQEADERRAALERSAR